MRVLILASMTQKTDRTLRVSAAAAAHAADIARRNELARLLPLWPRELADLSISGRRDLIKVLERALRGERKRGRAGHWTYDVARHAALIRNHRAECRSLAACLRRDAIQRHAAAKDITPAPIV